MSVSLACPKCQHKRSNVMDTRMAEDGAYIRRRRTCAGCGHRWSTKEVPLSAIDMEVRLRICVRDGKISVDAAEQAHDV